MLNSWRSFRAHIRRQYFNFRHDNSIVMNGAGNRICYNAHAVRQSGIVCSGGGNVIDIHPSASIASMTIEMQGKNNRILIGAGSLLGNMTIRIQGNDNTLIVGSDSRVVCNVTVNGHRHRISVGDSCVLQSGAFWFEDNDCLLDIGSRTTIIGADFSVTEDASRIVIGSDCLFAYGIDFRTGDSHAIFDLGTGKRINPAQNIVVGNHVWIGAFVKMLKGVTVGNHSVIGIGSVVTRNVPAHCIVAGSPAKVVRENIVWTHQRTDTLPADSLPEVPGVNV